MSIKSIIREMLRKTPKEDLYLLAITAFPFLLISLEEAVKRAQKKISKTDFGRQFESFYPPEELSDFEMRKRMPLPPSNLQEALSVTNKLANFKRGHSNALDILLDKENQMVVGKSFDVPKVLRCEILDYYAYLIAEKCRVWTRDDKNILKEISIGQYSDGRASYGLVFNGDGRYLVGKDCKRIYKDLKVDRFKFHKFLRSFK